jgi:GWxTD domain-containing protein
MGSPVVFGLCLSMLAATPRALPFGAEILPVVDERGPRVRVFVGVPYRDLQFIKTDGAYEARFRVSFEVVDEETAEALAKDWEASRRTTSYATTVSHTGWRTTCRTVKLEPGRYRATIQVKDLSSGRVGQRERKFSLGTMDSDDIDISAFLVEKGSGSCERTRPFWGDRQPTTPSLLWSLWSPTPGSASVRLRIEDTTGSKAYERDIESATDGRPQTLDLSGVELPPGVVTVRLDAEAGDRRGRWERQYRLRPRGMPTGERSVELMVEQMRAVVEPDEYEEMLTLPPDEKRTAFQAFWVRRDPTPETEENELLEEFLTRVEVVEEEFSVGDTPGWETDRGRIYLVYGSPDERKRFRSGRFEEKLHEVWRYYHLRRRFVFVDEFGDGRFALVSSS